MLRTALDRFDHDDYRIYVGVYPNDPGTCAAVAAVAAADARVRMVGGALPGPTSKAECLNRLWAQLCRDEAADGVPVKAVVLHDAEDVVHPAELRVFDLMIERYDLVQLPVLPLIDRRSRMVSGHYLDEFCDAHGRLLPVRQAVGAALPAAGVGCALSRAALGAMATRGHGAPFDPATLTEDYELGVRLPASGGRGTFVRLAAHRGGGLVAVRAYFPATFATAVRQKARWVTGIALAGWERLGWSGGWAERWMRLRDRRVLAAVVVIAASYAATLLWMLSWLLGRPASATPALALLLRITAGLLFWRIAMRIAMVAPHYGWREALLSVPRIMVGNAVAIAAAARAVRAYGLSGRPARGLRWDKTAHHFPDELPAA